MVKNLSSLNEYQDFIKDFADDPVFSDPHFSYDKDNLWGALHRSNQSVFGVFQGKRIVGLFVFLIIEDEKYAEMIVGFSKRKTAYEEMFQYICEQCGGFSVDFVLNPKNHLLRSVLQEYGASFEAEQQTMAWRTEAAFERKHNIQPYSNQYKEQYLSMHSKDVYWTGEKVISAADRFRVLLAVKEKELVGYLDITHCYDVNEPYDLQVKDCFKGQGCEEELLLAAIELNKPNGLTVMVDMDDTTSISTYKSVGFERVDNQDSITAHVKVRGSGRNIRIKNN